MKKQIILLQLFFLFFISFTFAQNQFTISGTVLDAKSGEDLYAVNVYIKEIVKGTTTNVYGFYSLTTKPGTYTIVYSYLGMVDVEKTIVLDKDIELNIELSENEVVTAEVLVTGEKKDKNIENAQTSVVELETKTVKEIPALLGEADIFRTLQLLPGVASAGEGNSGLYVRGGGPDQNLVLLDGATVYNPGHLLGFFSVFNADVVKNTTLYKGGIPAEYGGRISSVLDIGMKEGNMKEYEVEGGIGFISSRLTVQGPIVKEKASFIVSGRLTYLAFMVNPLLKKKEQSFRVPYFFDVNAKLNYKIGKKDRLFISGYFGRDKFTFASPGGGLSLEFPWGNATATMRWNHLFNDKLFMNNTFVFNDFNSKVLAEFNDASFSLNSGIRDYGLKGDLQYYPKGSHTLKFGYDYLFHTFTPYLFEYDTGNEVFSSNLTKKNAHEFALYVQDEWKVRPWLQMNAGVRFSGFSNVGPGEKIIYNEDNLAIDTISKAGIFNSFATYFGVEPRLNVRMKVNETSSFKIGFNYNKQYMHLVSQSSTTLPTDLWVPSSAAVKPQSGVQASVGFFKNFKDNGYETSIEVYYKKMWNLVEYGESTVVGDQDRDTEDQFVFGEGQSYGAEFFVKKKFGKFNGWVGYTLAWTDRTFPDVNEGEKFKAKYDRRHDLSIVLMYDISKKLKLSATFIYGSGQNTTIAESRYFADGNLRSVYGERNGYRLPAYHRLDLGLTYLLKDNDKRYSDLNFSIYNVYSRKNPYFIYDDINFNGDDGSLTVQAKQVSLFPILPTLTWNFKY